VNVLATLAFSLNVDANEIVMPQNIQKITLEL
jgi:hypothetical protein